MAEQTTNYGLTKPSAEDFYSVSVQNENMDALDTEIKRVEDMAAQKEDSIKNAEEKAALDDADTIPLSDEAAAKKSKKITFENMKQSLKSYFDTQYNKYVHPVTAGNRHIPAGGAAGQILRWDADGAAQWGADNAANVQFDNAGTGLAATNVQDALSAVNEQLSVVANRDPDATDTGYAPGRQWVNSQRGAIWIFTPDGWVPAGDNYIPDGATVMPTDDISLLLRCAGLRPTGAETAASVAADSTTMAVIAYDTNALDYLERCDPQGAIWQAFVGSETAMTQLDASKEALRMIFDYYDRRGSQASGDNLILSVVTGSETALSILKTTAVKVPTMTSDTTPTGYVAASAKEYTAGGHASFKAFDHNENTSSYGDGASTNWWISITFPRSYYFYACDLLAGNYTGAENTFTLKFQALVGNTWVDVVPAYQQYIDGRNSEAFWFYKLFNSAVQTNSLRLYMVRSTGGVASIVVDELQFWGKDLA